MVVERTVLKIMARAGISREDANMSNASVCGVGKYDVYKSHPLQGWDPYTIEHSPRFTIR